MLSIIERRKRAAAKRADTIARRKAGLKPWPYEAGDVVAKPAYKIHWDNGHAAGVLAGEYETYEAAEFAAKNWRAEMIAIDDDHAAAEHAYSYEIVTV